MSISAAARAQYAYNAGFRNTNAMESLSIMVAISLAECGLGGACETGCHPDGGWDSCGIVQISMQHSAVCNKNCALDPAAAMRYAFVLSGGGRNFSPWCTYDSPPGCGPPGSHAFRAHLDEARAAVNSLGGGTPPPPSPCPPGGRQVTVNGVLGCACNPETPCWQPGVGCHSAPGRQHGQLDVHGYPSGYCPCNLDTPCWDNTQGCMPLPAGMRPTLDGKGDPTGGCVSVSTPGGGGATGGGSSAGLVALAILGTAGLLAWHHHTPSRGAVAPPARRGGFPVRGTSSRAAPHSVTRGGFDG